MEEHDEYKNTVFVGIFELALLISSCNRSKLDNSPVKIQIVCATDETEAFICHGLIAIRIRALSVGVFIIYQIYLFIYSLNH